MGKHGILFVTKTLKIMMLELSAEHLASKMERFDINLSYCVQRTILVEYNIV